MSCDAKIVYLFPKHLGQYRNKLTTLTILTVINPPAFTFRHLNKFGIWESDVTSALFLVSQGSSMADAGVVETLLRRIEKVDDGVDSLEVANSLGVDHQVIVGAVKSLQSVGDVSFPG